MPYKTASAFFDHPILKLGQPTQDLHPEWASGNDDGSLLREIMMRVQWRRFLKGYNSILCIGEEIIHSLNEDVTAAAVDVSIAPLFGLVKEANIDRVAGFGSMRRSVCVLPESLWGWSDRGCEGTRRRIGPNNAL